MNNRLTDRIFALLLLISIVGLILANHSDGAFGIGVIGGGLLSIKFLVEKMLNE